MDGQPRIGPSERTRALAELQRIEQTLGDMSSWLDRNGYERPAILLEDAVRALWAAQVLIDRDPDRMKLLVPHGRALG